MINTAVLQALLRPRFPGLMSVRLVEVLPEWVLAEKTLRVLE